jgi:hypothetical protein
MVPTIERMANGDVIIPDGEHAGDQLPEILTLLFTRIDELEKRVLELERESIAR